MLSDDDENIWMKSRAEFCHIIISPAPVSGTDGKSRRVCEKESPTVAIIRCTHVFGHHPLEFISCSEVH